MDVSEQCGYTIVQQAALFHSIKPLFSNKPILIICNKIDTRPMSDLSAADLALIDEMVSEAKKISSGGAGGGAMVERVRGGGGRGEAGTRVS